MNGGTTIITTATTKSRSSPLPLPKLTSGGAERLICVVCAAESDGLHFGQNTCRACAAFFRRSISLKLAYVCKKDGICAVDKTARNMCRACRFRRCLEKGMLTSVQHARDGLGKRKASPRISSSSPMGSLLETNSIEGMKSGHVAMQVSDDQGLMTTTTKSSGNNIIFDYGGPAQQQLQTGNPSALSLLATNNTSALVVAPRQNQFLFATAPTTPSNLLATHQMLLQQVNCQQQHLTPTPLQLDPMVTGGGMFNVFKPHQLATGAVELDQWNIGTKHLHRMTEGYQKFLSLRKASYTLIEGFPFNNGKNNLGTVYKSSFANCRKVCLLEKSLIKDVLEKNFIPFGELPALDKDKLFENFYGCFANAERCYQTYKKFQEGDDRVIIPDGGYIRISEQEKFYQNDESIKGDPAQVAKIFEDGLRYKKKVSDIMRKLLVTETELIFLFGIFLWSPEAEVSPVTAEIATQIRNEIVMDIHLYYRAVGYTESGITLKTTNLLLLVPKMETIVRLFKENISIAELFNMLDENLMMSCSKC